MSLGKIIFIDPRGWQGAAEGQPAFPNLGIAYLAAAFIAKNFSVHLIDLNNQNLSNNQVLEIINQEQPDFIAFSVKTVTYQSADSLARQIKQAYPNIKLIAGGPHITLNWSPVQAENIWDVILLGEGEEVLPELCLKLLNHQSIADYSCLAGLLVDGSVETKHQPHFVKDLNRVLFPYYDFFSQNVLAFLNTSYPLLTSRGCVYRCIYCSVPLVSGHIFRKRSPENIVAELRQIKQKYKIQGFDIIDDNFNLDIERSKSFCRLLIKENLDFSWSCPNGIRADSIDQELADLMAASGCRAVNIGIESGDPKVFNNIHKGETLEQIERGIYFLKKANIYVTGFFIIGLPHDSILAQQKSLALIRRLKIDALFSMLVPYPSTKVWDWVTQNNFWLSGRNAGSALHFSDDKNKLSVAFETPEFSAQDKKRAYEMLNLKLGHFSLLVSKKVFWPLRYMKILGLIWQHNKLNPKEYWFLCSAIWRKIKYKIKVKFLF